MPQVQFHNGVVLFRGGQVAMDPSCCCDELIPFEDCLSCCPWPQYATVTLSGVVATDPAECDDCDQWNDTFILEKYGETCTSETSATVAYRVRPFATACHPCPLIDLTIACDVNGFTIALSVWETDISIGDGCEEETGYTGFAQWDESTYQPAYCQFEFQATEWSGSITPSTGGFMGCDFSNANASFSVGL